ncbi:MAG: response regulator [Pseudomonadota bacterium]
MNGYEATMYIRTLNGKHTPIVDITADVVQSDYERYIAAGMDYYLYKPIKAEKI